MNLAPRAIPERVAKASESELEAELWRQARSGVDRAREALFERHAPLARRIAARQLRNRTAGDLDMGDLRQMAYAGLLEAIDRFDPARGVPFAAYASRRIAGSIADGVAKTSEIREQYSHRNRVRAERARSLAARDPEALAGREAIDALAELAVGLALGFMLDAAGLAAGPDTQDTRPSPYEGLAWREALTRLGHEIGGLPDREQAVIRRHYLDGLDFTEIGRLLGLTKGRISQLHRAALAQLRDRMAPRRHLDMEG